MNVAGRNDTYYDHVNTPESFNVYSVPRYATFMVPVADNRYTIFTKVAH